MVMIKKVLNFKFIFTFLLLGVLLIQIIILKFEPLEKTAKIVAKELIIKGLAYIKLTERLNSKVFKEGRSLDYIDTGFFYDYPFTSNVVKHVLFDMEGRIIRPASKLNQYIKEDILINARNKLLLKQDHQDIHLDRISLNEFFVAGKIVVFNDKIGSPEPVAILALYLKSEQLSLLIHGEKDEEEVLKGKIVKKINKTNKIIKKP
jgi:hypothetical protein